MTSYDDLPYSSHPFAQTHLDRLATIAHILKLSTTDLTQSKVLEIGCASGGNLIPMAFHLPQSDFVGIDFSIQQVTDGQRIIKDLNLKNIKIIHANIIDIDSTWGKFDYIICHGVYSWVCEEVKDKILSVCSENLSPEGIAYISYNTYPGWHMREMIRHAMLFHANQFDDTSTKIKQARAVIDFLSDAVSTDKDNHYGILLKNELELIRKSSDAYLFHDHMEEINTPVYFHQIIDDAGRHGLQYLGEADFSTMLVSGFPKKVADTLNRISNDIISTEQYMDFIRNRHFRQTLFCHKKHKLRRDIKGDHITKLLVASQLQPDKVSFDYASNEKQCFSTPFGISIETDYPLTKAALKVLKDLWPRAIQFDDLFSKALQLLASLPIDERKNIDSSKEVLADDLLHCFAANAIEFHTWQPDYVTTVSKKPKVSTLAVYQAENKQIVVNHRHETIDLDSCSRYLIPLLNGTSDRNALVDCLKGYVSNGKLTLRINEKTLSDKKTNREALEKIVKKTLDNLAKASMFVA